MEKSIAGNVDLELVAALIGRGGMLSPLCDIDVFATGLEYGGGSDVNVCSKMLLLLSLSLLRPGLSILS